jgi:hypothetical protein
MQQKKLYDDIVYRTYTANFFLQNSANLSQSEGGYAKIVSILTTG